MSLTPIAPESLNLTNYIRPQDLVSWGQAMSEPRDLIKKYTDQRHEIGPTSAFVGLSLEPTIRPEHTDLINLKSYGALGHTAKLFNAGLVDLIPCRYSELPKLIQSGRLQLDVLFVQLSPAGPDGTHSLGWSNDLLHIAMKHARVVIAEINPAVPWVRMDQPIDESRITATIQSSYQLPQLPSPKPSPTDAAIAGHLAPYIPDGSTLQYGIGAIPSAILKSLVGHRDLGVHSGLITDELVDLAECGALTNANKAVLPGVSVGAIAIGGPKLARFMTDNLAFKMCQTSMTHGAQTLAQLANLVAINSALEVDLLGQINAEQVGARYLGAIGGQPDFMHAATSAPDGLSVIAMPATGGGGKHSRVVSQLNGPQVSTARSDVDLIVTEYGVADMRGKSVTERTKALINIAAPEHREALSRTATKELL